MKTKYKPLGDRAFSRYANMLARDRLPYIYPCGRCYKPVVSGEICTWCRESNPQHSQHGNDGVERPQRQPPQVRRMEERMKVGQLRKLIIGVSDDAEVLLPAADHSYRRASSLVLDAVNRGKGRERGEWWEYHGEENQVPDAESDVVSAVVIR